MPSLTEDTRIVFTAAILFAIAYPGLAGPLKWALTPSLVVAMTLALRGIDYAGLSLSGVRSHVIKSLALHYILLNLLILLSAYYLIEDPEYLAGFIIMAAIPPAVSTVPFTFLLNGDTRLSAVTEVSAYILSLFYTPLLIFTLLEGSIEVSYLIQLLAVLIMFPLVLSRLLAKSECRIWASSKSVITLLFGLITYVILGLNHDLITSDPLSLTPVVTVVFIRTMLIGSLVYYATRKTGPAAITYTLFSSYKNNGAAAVIAILLLSVKSSMPMAFAAIFEPVFIIILQNITGVRSQKINKLAPSNTT
ncbi:MAG: hypothetical protein ABIH11_03495 [Candidatus Altiarchaeota archaeon]